MAAAKPTAKATASQATPATTSAATRAAAIAPERTPLHLEKLPSSGQAILPKGTIGGTANAIAKGGNRGFKIGMAVAVVAFSLPSVPAASAVVAQASPELW